MALAPVVSIKHTKAQLLRDLFEESEANVDWVRSFGPELLTKAPNDGIMASFMMKSIIGEKTSSIMLQKVSDL